MKQLPFKLSLLIFLMSLMSGFYLRLPLIDNLLRSFVIYLIFSVLILIFMLIYTQSAANALHAGSKREPKRGQEDTAGQTATNSTN